VLPDGRLASDTRRKLAEAEAEIARLKKRDGDLFDLKTSTPQQISDVMADPTNMSDRRATETAKLILDKVKKRNRKPAG
jgi:hypothetical protein